jgi:hypothetical protein
MKKPLKNLSSNVEKALRSRIFNLGQKKFGFNTSDPRNHSPKMETI